MYIYIEEIINKINNLKIMVIKNIIWDLKTKGRRGWSYINDNNNKKKSKVVIV